MLLWVGNAAIGLGVILLVFLVLALWKATR